MGEPVRDVKVPWRRSPIYRTVVSVVAVYVWAQTAISLLSHDSEPVAATPAAVAHLSPADSSEAQLARQRHEAALRQIDQLRREEETAAREFEAFASENLVPEHDDAEPTAPLEANPEWQKIATHLEELDARRLELMQRLTPEHPQARQLQADISEVQQRLAMVPQFITAASTTVESIESMIPKTSVRREAPAMLAQLREDWLSAKERLKKAELHEELARERHLKTVDDLEIHGGRAARPRHEVPTTSLSRWALWAIVGSLALVGGGIVMAAQWDLTTTFASARQIEAATGLPVLGVVAALGAPGTPSETPSEATWSRLLLLACEITVAVFAWGVAVLAMRDRAIGLMGLADPVGTVQAGIAWLLAR